MDKYTLKTIFERSFSGVIWRIEADTAAKTLAIESRSPDDGLPTFSVVRYTDGHSLVHERAYGDRQWTLAGIAEDCILLRAIGQSQPSAPGIACLSSTSGETRWENFSHTFVAMHGGCIQARPRHIASGYYAYLAIRTGQPVDSSPSATKKPDQPEILLPSPTIDLPEAIVESYPIVGTALHFPFGDKDGWAFHIAQDDGYAVNLIITQERAILQARTLMTGLEKMIPEIFFVIGRQLFFIAGNKQEIVSYLV